MLNELLVFLLYLFYGLAFFTMGAAITAKSTRGSNLAIAPRLWLFSLFAFVHAGHEWFELFLTLDLSPVPAAMLPVLGSLKLGSAFVSFCFLLLFGISVLGIVQPQRRRRYRLLAAGLVALWLAVLADHGFDGSPAFFRFASYRMRNLVAFPGGLLSGLGFILYARSIRHLSARGARSFTWAGVGLIVYGVLAGLIPSRTLLLTRFQVELFRGLSALCIMHFVMNALHVFDVERRELIEERLRRFARSEKLTALGKLAAGIAHEINNPLANVSLNVEMLRKAVLSGATGEPLEKRLTAIERNLERASRIARELLTFSRHDERQEDAVPLDLNAVLRSTLTLLGPRRSEYRLTLALNPLPPVRGIPWKLEEVFLNVLLNAMEATAAGGEIAIGSRAGAGTALVEIADRGGGILPENLGSIFDPFFTTKEVGKGTGLGLSICFGIMQRHGGRIDVTSKPGVGTTVTMTFPAEGGSDGP